MLEICEGGLLLYRSGMGLQLVLYVAGPLRRMPMIQIPLFKVAPAR
jgi:hypothetical protein